jgi:membrane associated rhomboid family serine protease
MATCYRHPSVQTGVSCSSCGRPICPDCMTPSPVGMRCPECAGQRSKASAVRAGLKVRRRPAARVARIVHLGNFHAPQVTFGLIVINLILYLGERGQFGLYQPQGNFGGTLVAEGVLYRGGIEAHQYWRLVSSGFLHESIVHIGFNMWLLYLLGNMLEPAIGSLRFAAVYFTALLAGSCGALFATAAPSLGASGAIFGLMGAAVVELRARRIGVMESGIGGLIILNLAFSFLVPNISVGAHIGGLLGGFLAGAAIRAGDERRVPAFGFVACLALCVAAVAVSVAVAGATGTGIA